MKKLILLVLMAMVIVSPFANAAIPTTTPTHTTPAPTTATHIVYIEEGTATWCPNCPNAAYALHSMFENETTHTFYYAALVYDQSLVAKNWFLKYYGAGAFPSVFFDGGTSYVVGSASTMQATKDFYIPVLNDAATRTVQPLTLTTTVTGANNNKYTIKVTVTNTGSKPYFGFVRSAITEIQSRWLDEKHKPYHYGLLDYAIKKPVLLTPGKSKTISKTWDGTVKHGNLTFTDLTDSNILVITSVSQLRINKIPADKDNYIRAHYAFFVDQTDAATVTTD